MTKITRKVNYDVVSKPSKDTLGKTYIYENLTIEGVVNPITLPLGFLLNEYGADKDYRATVLVYDSQHDIGTFDTRSKGAHAIRKKYYELSGKE